VNITGQITQLAVLAKALITIALGGVALALLLGMLIGRAAISPLSEMADEIEGVANSKDLSIRVKEKGRDELGRLGRVFNRLLGDIQLSRDQQRQLVMDASHELRTPLTSLRTNAQVIGQVAKHKPEDLDQLTEDMVSQVDELSALVSDLAELARGERSEGAVVEVDLSEVVHECVAVARTHARVKAIEIEHESTPGRVLARQDRLVQLVNNLLSNAVKFTPEGGHIKVTSEGYVLTVQDSGPGIAPEDRAYVTQRFWRSPAARSMPGSGLGLSIVAQVAGEMGGVIGVGESQELGGAQISVSFMQQDLRVK
jgi:two-component system sensor histidine kinase MprB